MLNILFGGRTGGGRIGSSACCKLIGFIFIFVLNPGVDSIQLSDRIPITGGRYGH